MFALSPLFEQYLNSLFLFEKVCFLSCTGCGQLKGLIQVLLQVDRFAHQLAHQITLLAAVSDFSSGLSCVSPNQSETGANLRDS